VHDPDAWASSKGERAGFGEWNTIKSTGLRSQVVALTDTVFTTLDARMEEMNAVKEEREATLGELKEVLMSMWSSVGITEDDENRKFFERMLSSPSRLHTHTHEKVRGPHLGCVTSHAYAPVVLCSIYGYNLLLPPRVCRACGILCSLLQSLALL
jgi:hypothetical protein